MNKTGEFDSKKMYTYIKGYASGARMKQTRRALSFVRQNMRDRSARTVHPTSFIR